MSVPGSSNPSYSRHVAIDVGWLIETKDPQLIGDGRGAMEKDLANKNLFMMCKVLNPEALAELPNAYHVRTCRRDELDMWAKMPFDDPLTADKFSEFMMSYFNDVYADSGNLFFQSCLFVCDKNDTPIATCFGWKAYRKISTIHWFKVLKAYEGQGIGRALLSIVMQSFSQDDFPIYLHTQPSSFRAIKLYSDFGFAFLTDETIGFRQNDLKECLPYLKTQMFQSDFENIRLTRAPRTFLDDVKSSRIGQF